MKFLLTPLMCALLAAPAFAQEKPDTDKRIADLERRLDAMSRELESQKTGSVVPPAGEEGRFGLGAAASKVYAAPAGLSIGGYGEFLYQNFDSKLQNGTKAPREANLDALRLVLYTGYKFTDRIVFNSELEFEHGGYSDESTGGEVKVEFAYLDFLVDKAFNVRAGMMLLPVGFINEMHEPPAFLGSQRPLVERRIIPSTWHENGVGLHGELPGNLSYRLYLVNGMDANPDPGNGHEGFTAESIKGGRQFGKEAKANSLAWTGRLDWAPIPGTTLGFSFYRGNSNPTDGAESLMTTLWDVHAEYRAAGLQLRGLFSRVTNSEAGVAALPPTSDGFQTGTRQFGGYLEAGYDVLRGTGKQALIPFVRYERLNSQQRVVEGVTPDFANDVTVKTVGVSYKPIPNVAVKADWNKIENRAETGRDQFNLGLGFYF
ncbi:OprO/OprP family phosphate-selective porin [Geothrix terrae]|uniref:OprO/OprP family phosphate-selective porin n=1 Tax=Geothrix terrae TaxID=2922720 RepID=UPI001FADFD4C|nr:OprO/OprP family phosphate-selective porin [Geothrix terrae]